MPSLRASRCPPWAVALAAAALAACTLPVATADAGSDAGVPSQTVGDRCSAMFAEACSQSIDRCGAIGSLGDCIAMNLPTCCTGTLCNATSKVPPAVAAACNQQIDLEQCYDLSTNPIPDACQGVLHQP